MKKIVLLILGFFCLMMSVEAEDINSAFFIGLDITNGVMSPAFDKNITEYSVYLPEEESVLSIDYELEDPYASLMIVGNDYLNLGLNEVLLCVVSSDDEIIINYKLVVTKDDSVYTFEEDSESVALEIPVSNKTEVNYDNKAQLIVSVCFIIVLFTFGFLFGKRKPRK